MSKNKSQKKAQNTEELKAKTEKTNEQHLAERMKDVSKILKLSEEGLDNIAIASKVRIGVSYVEEVVKKGAAEMEVELRQGYGMAPMDAASETNVVTETEASPESGNATNDTSPIDTVTETAADKKAKKAAEKAAAKEAAKTKKAEEKAAKAPAEPKAPKEKRTRENALIQALKESNGTGLTLEAVGARANEILSITRKSWTGTLGAMKRANEITYNKESKLYNVP